MEIRERFIDVTGSKVPNTGVFRIFVRRSYKELLLSLGRPVYSRRENRFWKDFPLLTVLKAWLAENNIVLSPFEGHYKLSHTRMRDTKVDWNLISEKVQALVPVAQRGMYTSERCCGRWWGLWKSFKMDQILQEANWDAITSKN
jgi:hypothetical protein